MSVHLRVGQNLKTWIIFALHWLGLGLHLGLDLGDKPSKHPTLGELEGYCPTIWALILHPATVHRTDHTERMSTAVAFDSQLAQPQTDRAL